ncbi:MAG: hypothetical protein CVV41_17635, partial [Candidatus Riflebacteria bacterium HGW-Riflebacteria-1]
MSGTKASKLVQAFVDRVVNDVVVVVIRHPGAAEDEPDTFKEIYIPGERFKEFPNEGEAMKKAGRTRSRLLEERSATSQSPGCLQQVAPPRSRS